MSVNHAREAEKYLSHASYRSSNKPNAEFTNAETAGILAQLAQAHATLAHLPEQQVVALEQLEKVLQVVVGHVREMSTSAHPELRKWADGLAKDMDRFGVNIDDRLQELAERHGYGPTLYDIEGRRYDLTRQLLDAKGKRWEHTGGWTPGEVPVMGRDDKSDLVLDLIELVKTRGPLIALTQPKPGTYRFAEPPF